MQSEGKSSMRPPSQRLADGKSNQDGKSVEKPTSTNLKRRSLPRPLSLKLEPTENLDEKTTLPTKPASPTRLPMGASRRPTLTKQSLPTPDLKPTTSTHKRQISLGKTPSLRKPTESSNAASKPTQPTLRTSQVSQVKRQTSPSRTPSVITNVRPKGPNVSTRSSSITVKPLKVESEPGDRKSRNTATPPQDRPAFNGNHQSYTSHKATSSGKESTIDQSQNQYSKDNLDSTLELLHLHTLHRGSAKVQQEWLSSAKSSFKVQFDALAKLSSDLNDKEKDLLEQGNAAAIIAWGGQSGSDTIERKVQSLSAAISETYDLTEHNGRYTMAVQAFEHWFETANQIQRRRLDGRTNRVDLIEGLGDGWKSEIASLQARAIRISNEVLSLGDVHAHSDLSRCVTAVSEMLMNMLEELEAMQFIEDTLVEQEQFWMQTSVERMASDLRSALPE